jgi:hypothetical protein
MRRSLVTERNKQLGDWSEWAKGKDNLAYFKEALEVMEREYGVGNRGQMVIGLVGSRDLPGVTLRRAQAILRWDRRPSLWSHAFLIAKPWAGRGKIERLPVLEVPLHPRTGLFPRPESNGLNSESTLGSYANPKLDANLAMLAVSRRKVDKDGTVEVTQLSRQELKAVADRAGDPNYDRLRYDLWDGLSAWQRYLWSDLEGANPLRNGVPVPATAYIEMAFEAMGLDLVPGASERNSAPEHIWNAAVWWHQEGMMRIEGDESPFVITGCWAARDPGCSLLGREEIEKAAV